jgi:hypothetical protein
MIAMLGDGGFRIEEQKLAVATASDVRDAKRSLPPERVSQVDAPRLNISDVQIVHVMQMDGINSFL